MTTQADDVEYDDVNMTPASSPWCLVFEVKSIRSLRSQMALRVIVSKSSWILESRSSPKKNPRTSLKTIWVIFLLFEMKRKKVEEKGLLDKNELEVTLTIEDGTQTVEEERTVPCFCTAAPLLEYNCSNACSYDWCSHRSVSLETAWRTTREDFSLLLLSILFKPWLNCSFTSCFDPILLFEVRFGNTFSDVIFTRIFVNSKWRVYVVQEKALMFTKYGSIVVLAQTGDSR